MPMACKEINFDGLVGPTHNYAGLSYGNVASRKHEAQVSHPRKAALQGLEKAYSLAMRGHPQAILPPHERPSIHALRAWGFDGRTDAEVLAKASAQAPQLLACASSASAMWTANACTMAPSSDTSDARVHFTPANLSGNLHRALEAPFTEHLLKHIFPDPDRFAVHSPLPGGDAMADEGAANHTRLHGEKGPGLHLFVYGRSALDASRPAPRTYPARQTLESVEAIARRHRIQPSSVLLLQQAPEAIDAGVFHNDVISVGNADLFLYHERAFAQRDALHLLRQRYQELCGKELHLIKVSEQSVPLAEAVRTYLFNSQLLSQPDGRQCLVCPIECRESTSVAPLLKAWRDDPGHPVSEVLFFDLRESMNNGGGPACLRQRIVLTGEETKAMRGRLMLDEGLYHALTGWVRSHYRETLAPADLADPKLLEESRTALDELTRILRLPALYPFQRDGDSPLAT